MATAEATRQDAITAARARLAARQAEYLMPALNGTDQRLDILSAQLDVLIAQTAPADGEA